jgi:hypothetical protein
VTPGQTDSIKFILRHHFAGMEEQLVQQIQRLRFQIHRLAVTRSSRLNSSNSQFPNRQKRPEASLLSLGGTGT